MIRTLSEDCTIILGDCKQWLGEVKFDAIITDHPYGINFQHSGCSNEFIKKSDKSFSVSRTRPILGDDKPFDPTHLLAAVYESKGHIKPLAIFGANHFCQYFGTDVGGQWYVWDKSCGKGPNSSFIDAEFIWANRKNPRCIFRHLWMGAIRAGEGSSENEKRMHVSQKPIELMVQLVESCRVGVGQVVCDPYMGSGSTGIAALRTGRKFVGIELDEYYFKIAEKRLMRELRQQFMRY